MQWSILQLKATLIRNKNPLIDSWFLKTFFYPINYVAQNEVKTKLYLYVLKRRTIKTHGELDV
jgi:hypothetical protein